MNSLQSSASRLASLAVIASAGLSSSHAAELVSHWEMNNPAPYSNSVPGGPAMVHDAATRAPATFDANETRLETSFDATKSTRIAASDASLDIASFSFSLIIDPTDVINFGSILNKESNYSGGDPYQRVGWQVIHTEFGNLEFVVRGDAGGFFGAITVLSAQSGFTAGANFDSDIRYQLAGGYDSATGDAFFYVTQLTGGTLTALTGSTSSFALGALQDSGALSLGTKNTAAGYDGNGAGFDVADLQLYSGLLSSAEVLQLANNPGSALAIPEPSGAAALLGLAAAGFAAARRRRRA